MEINNNAKQLEWIIEKMFSLQILIQKSIDEVPISMTSEKRNKMLTISRAMKSDGKHIRFISSQYWKKSVQVNVNQPLLKKIKVLI